MKFKNLLIPNIIQIKLHETSYKNNFKYFCYENRTHALKDKTVSHNKRRDHLLKKKKLHK